MLIKGLKSQKCFLCSVMRKRHSRNWDVSRFTYEFRMIIWCFSRFRLALLLVPYCPLLENTSISLKVWILSSGCSHLYSIQMQPTRFNIFFFLMDLPFDPIITFVKILINNVVDSGCFWLIDIEYLFLCNQLLLKV